MKGEEGGGGKGGGKRSEDGKLENEERGRGWAGFLREIKRRWEGNEGG